MSRSWLGRPTGRHAAGRRRRPVARPAEPVPAEDRVEQTPPRPPRADTVQADTVRADTVRADTVRADDAQLHEARLFSAPTMADATAPHVSSPVTEEARAAAAGISPPAFVPPGVSPLVTVDALGRKCPLPIIMLAERIRDVPVGSVIAVLADDPAAYNDIPAWCGLKSHDCVFRADYAAGWSFGILRRY